MAGALQRSNTILVYFILLYFILILDKHRRYKNLNAGCFVSADGACRVFEDTVNGALELAASQPALTAALLPLDRVSAPQFVLALVTPSGQCHDFPSTCLSGCPIENHPH